MNDEQHASVRFEGRYGKDGVTYRQILRGIASDLKR